jgi:hypothetical protein
MMGIWIGDPPDICDINREPIVDEFIDGKTRAGPWANMCPKCYKIFGVGRLGTGFGQRYKKQDDGTWLKVEG